MPKWDVYALVAVQIEAETQEQAQHEAEHLPLEYWWPDFEVCEVVGVAD